MPIDRPMPLPETESATRCKLGPVRFPEIASQPLNHDALKAFGRPRSSDLSEE